MSGGDRPQQRRVPGSGSRRIGRVWVRALQPARGLFRRHRGLAPRDPAARRRSRAQALALLQRHALVLGHVGEAFRRAKPLGRRRRADGVARVAGEVGEGHFDRARAVGRTRVDLVAGPQDLGRRRTRRRGRCGAGRGRRARRRPRRCRCRCRCVSVKIAPRSLTGCTTCIAASITCTTSTIEKPTTSTCLFVAKAKAVRALLARIQT